MTFEAIMQIDSEPFDSDATDLFCDPHMSQSIFKLSIQASLVKRYFEQFNKKYNAGMEVFASHIMVTSQSVEDYEVDDMDWFNAGYELCYEAMKAFGWNSLIISAPVEEVRRWPADIGEAEELAKMQILTGLDQSDSITVEMVLNELDIWLDTARYMEDGFCFFFWNNKLSSYLKWRDDNPEMVKQICGKEDAEIISLLSYIWHPILYFDNCSDRCVSGRYYGLESLGCNGESTVDFNSFNPNWVSKAFVLDRLLSLVESKIEFTGRRGSIMQ